MVLAIEIICEAVQRYKELCEGAYCGEANLRCMIGMQCISNFECHRLYGYLRGTRSDYRLHMLVSFREGRTCRFGDAYYQVCALWIHGATKSASGGGQHLHVQLPWGTGQSVDRVQIVRSIEFCYQPPPRSAVPYAAALKGQSGRCLSRSLSQYGKLSLLGDNFSVLSVCLLALQLCSEVELYSFSSLRPFALAGLRKPAAGP